MLAVVLAASVLAGLGYVWREGERRDTTAPAPTVSIVVSIPPAVTVQQSPGATPSPTRGRTPSVSATPGLPSPTPTPSRFTPQQAGQAVLAVVDRRSAAGEIRSDVVDDIRNQVNNIIGQPAGAGPRIDRLRNQLLDRRREGSITTTAAYDELDAAVAAFGASLA